MKHLILAVLAVSFFAPIVAPAIAEAAQVTIEGVIDKVVTEKTEIYVVAGGKKHELYFSKKTEVVKGSAPLTFSDLKVNQKVKVVADKVGRRLDPLRVEIVD